MATVKRVTVKVEHKKKMFFEKFLHTWKEDVEDRKQTYVIFRALQSLKSCPLEVETVRDLKNLIGFGENIAVRCLDAWNFATGNDDQKLSLKDVKALKSEDYLRYLNGTKTVRERKRDDLTKKKNPARVSSADEFADSDDEPISSSKPSTSTFQKQVMTKVSTSLTVQRLTSANSLSSIHPSTTTVDEEENFRFITCRPFEEARVVLIADNREHRQGRVKSTVEHLADKKEITLDMRPLSVGDYIWVARKVDGTEVVLDWVVERKTWRDLKDSIRGGRYDEQKARLNMAPMRKRVYLIEANDRGDDACEQAVTSTLVNGGYLIQRCSDTRDTANFLVAVTLQLEKDISAKQITGVPFHQLQSLMKKQKAETVKDCWARQLMVCPGMSFSRAKAIADKFPSLPALLAFFQANGQDAQIELQNVVPQITKPIARHLQMFFIGC